MKYTRIHITEKTLKALDCYQKEKRLRTRDDAVNSLLELVSEKNPNSTETKLSI